VSSAYLLLEDGTRFDGAAVGADGSVTGEVVFTALASISMPFFRERRACSSNTSCLAISCF